MLIRKVNKTRGIWQSFLADQSLYEESGFEGSHRFPTA